MAYNKVFFHMGTPCQSCGGVGDMWKTLDAGGIPFGVYSVENGGLIVEAARLPRADPIIYRTLATDVAPYNLAPKDAAAQQWALLMEKLPPEVKALKSRAWIEIGNEQDKTRADWLGNYYAELAAIALPQGYRICGPAWSTGEPEPPDWETPGWLRYLRLCAANPARLAVTVHEYGLNANDIRAGFPYLTGRVRFLFDACDKHGISRPAVFVTEAGWVHNDMPEPDAAKNDIAWLSSLYAGYPTVKAAFLWTLMGGGDKKELGATLNSIVPWLTEWTLRQRWPDPPPPPTEELMILDLSRWNGTLNAAKMKAAGVAGVILRAAAGATRDTMVDTYAPALKAAGVPIIGAYLYYHPYEPWRPQLDALKAVMVKHGIRRGYLDLEDAKTVPTLARDAETFMAALAAEMPLPAGKRHGVYSNVAYWRQMGAPGWGSQYDLWIAAWTAAGSPIVPAPWPKWTFWQYSNSGDGPRYGLQSARVDLNRFNGTAAQFAEWLKIEDAPLDVPAAIRGGAAKQPGAGWHPTHAIPMAIIRDGYLPVGPEFDVTAGGVAYRGLRAFDRTGKMWIYYAPVPRWNEVTRIAA